jgi:hypothetical protein
VDRHGRQIEIDEDMPRAPERLTDALGFFTFGSTGVRRYSN